MRRGRQRLGFLNDLAVGADLGGRDGGLAGAVEGLDEGGGDALDRVAPCGVAFGLELGLALDVDGLALLRLGPAVRVLLHFTLLFFLGDVGGLDERLQGLRRRGRRDGGGAETYCRFRSNMSVHLGMFGGGTDISWRKETNKKQGK